MSRNTNDHAGSKVEEKGGYGSAPKVVCPQAISQPPSGAAPGATAPAPPARDD